MVATWHFFMRIRLEGCTMDAMDSVAAEAHFEMVRWLHEHQIEGCTRQAMRDAVQCGYVEIMECLSVHVGMNFGGDFPSEKLGSLHWFYENHRDECDMADIQDLAEADDRDDIIEWLRNVGE